MKKINGHSHEELNINEVVETLEALQKTGQTILDGIHRLEPNVDVDLDRFVLIDLAIGRMFTNPHQCDSHKKLGATVGMMSFAVAQQIRGSKRKGIPEFAHEDEYRERIIHAGIKEDMAKTMGENWGAVSWDMLNTDPARCVATFKQFLIRNA
jgi:hypothetical protein